MRAQTKQIKKISKIKQPVIRPCPCVVDNLSCGYIIISHILGCPFDCSYCFLKTFYGQDEIVVYDNHDDIIDQVSSFMKKAEQPLRIGTGQYSDSLALPEARELGKRLVELFAGQEKHLLELKTKSQAVAEFLNLNHNGKTVMAWSVNPDRVIEAEEIGTEGLGARIEAAKRCVAAGYKVAFHFDPIYHYDGWENDYRAVVDRIFQAIKPQDIAWISLGALRYKKKRYPEEVRIEIFKTLFQAIRAYAPDVYVYLCMESDDIWRESGIINGENEHFTYHRRR
jgi:spore photoproduct lyase